ncbi:MAG TPA: hypothetical protein VFF59_07160, partial [Anaerolineae bacterium]|nr:hypothetical protein [Anaerolineae bacterium]
LIIAATLGQQRALADPVIFDLKPPFQFVETQSPDQPLIGLPPLGSTVIMTETFGPGFNPIPSLIGSTPQWRKVVNSTDTAGYYWGRVSGTPPVTFTNSAWSAMTPVAGQTVLTPGVDNHPTGQDTWLIYGPIDLSRYQYATLTFQYYLDADANDTLLWGTFKDPSHVYGASVGGTHNRGWITSTFAFDRSTYGDNAVYLAFAFQSRSANGLGAFIRHVQLNAEPFYFVYAPLVLNNYPPTPTPTPTLTPTPTPTPIPALYSYQFDEDSPRGAGSDLVLWGGTFEAVKAGDFGDFKYGQDVRLGHGNPRNSLRLYTTASYVVNAASPNNYTPANFDLYADMSPWVLYPNSMYGLVFGASDNAFSGPAGPLQGDFYLLYVGTGPNAKPIGIRLDKCPGGNCQRLSGDAGNDGFIALPASFIGNASAWDTLHLRRNGATLSVWVNDTFMFSKDDTTFTGARKWGMFILPNSGPANLNGIPSEVNFDHIRLNALP